MTTYSPQNRPAGALTKWFLIALVAFVSIAMVAPPANSEPSAPPDIDVTQRRNLEVGCEGNLTAGFTEVLRLNIVSGPAYTPKRPPKYVLDERDRYAETGVGRVAYCMEIGDEWVLTTFDAPSSDSSELGVPIRTSSFQQVRRAIDVRTNVDGIPTGDSLAGAIEFWPNKYDADRQTGVPGASDDAFDVDDTRRSGSYGSMQVHLTETDMQGSATVWAFNRFAIRGAKDVGIGTRSTGAPDWTLARNSKSLDAPRLRVFAQASAGTITDAGALQTGAIIPRRPLAASGRTVVSGSAPDATSVRVSVRDGALLRRFRQTAIADDGTFSIDVDVPARARSHSVVVEAMVGGKPKRLLTAADVAGGDLVVIQGQSNSVARNLGKRNNSAKRESRWIRSYGSSMRVNAPKAYGWNQANARSSYDLGSVGQWGLQLGHDLFTATSVPVVVINGAEGGEGARFFQRNDDDPMDPATNYGRLLGRIDAAGLDNSPTTFAWYQGEADWRQPKNQVDFVNPLFDAWAEDMPQLQHIYSMQIRNGCGSRDIADGDLRLRETQRQIAAQRDEVTLVSTSALPGHDGCHFSAKGYAALGSHLATLFQRDQFGTDFGAGIEGPRPISIRFTNKSRKIVEIILSDPNDVPLLNDTQEFASSSKRRKIVRMTAKPGRIILRFNRALPKRATLRYVGSELPVVTSSQGVGMIAFDDIRIAPANSSPKGLATDSD